METTLPSKLSGDQLHSIFTTDPAELMRFVGCEVCVTLNVPEKKGFGGQQGADSSLTGWVYTIDPVSQSIALVQIKDPTDEAGAELTSQNGIDSNNLNATEEPLLPEDVRATNDVDKTEVGSSGVTQMSGAATGICSDNQLAGRSCRGSKIEVRVVMGHALQAIVVLDDDITKHKTMFDHLFKSKQTQNASPDQLKRQRERVKSWLLKNRLPVREEENELHVCEALCIEPPYTAENCRSTNEIILGRIQGLLQNMPTDVEEW